MTMIDRHIAATRQVLDHLRHRLDLPLSVRLWDGSIVPLGRDAPPDRCVVIAGPGVIGALLRRPGLDMLFRQWTLGGIDLEGLDLIEAMDLVRSRRKAASFAALRPGFPWRAALPLLLARDRPAALAQAVAGGEAEAQRRQRGDRALIQFHYDASNAFYALFLDPEMVYSCAYFTDWDGSLEQAQLDKLELVCRKLRLRPGERFLDIGCGWGALICHAARYHGVLAHGVTLSQAQHDFAVAKIAGLGLQERVSVELRDYRSLTGTWDKIASIGMYEHVGIANYDAYFRKIHGLLAEGGIFLNHGITRRAKRDERRFRRASESRRVILKYIFPGSELDHIGHTVAVMETAGFEVHDVEGLRRHYARTCSIWHDRLVARRAEAIAHVGPERYRMWIAYLAGVAGAFAEGPLRIFQTVATRQSDKAAAAMPATRADLYAERVYD
ncbi:MAG: cyclopropane-fatty-acyl-phospholipid synthase family protein [Geminicoccaceae bacterium]